MIQLKHTPSLNTFLSQKLTTPRYQPSVTSKLHQSLYDSLTLFINRKLSPEDIKAIARIFSEEVGKCKEDMFISALQYFTVHPLSESFLKFICCQVAAARQTLKKGTPLDLFKGAQGFEWAPFKVTEVLQDAGNASYHLMCQFLDGRAYGTTFDLVRRSVGYQFYREAGVPKRTLRGVKLNPKDIVGFEYLALLQYKAFFPLDFTNRRLKRLDTDAVAAIRCTSSQAQRNKRLYKERLTPCPLKLRFPCAECFIGYDYCPRGCRKSTNWAASTKPPSEILINGKRATKI
jgi:hypothetical protein